VDVVGSVDGRGSVVSVSDRSENGLGEARMVWLMDECEGEDGAEEDGRWQ
jgi:hypothetical protein